MEKQEIAQSFKKTDSVMYDLAKKSRWLKVLHPKRPEEYFESVCKDIVGQQLSSKAGDTIWGRIITLFPNNKIIPQHVLSIDIEQLRTAGTSYAKARYLKNIAQAVVDTTLPLSQLKSMNDGEVVQVLTRIKGIGKWTAEMFLMFTLGRENVFSHGDAGLRKALCFLYKLPKDVSLARIDSIVDTWSPYKTYACLLLWESLES